MRFLSLIRWLGPLLLCACLFQAGRAQNQRLPTGNLNGLTLGQAKTLSRHIEKAQANGQQLRKVAYGTTFIGIKPWRISGSVYWDTDSNIYKQIIYMNRDFRKANIQFYVVSSGIGTITATASETLAYPNDEANLLSQNFDATAINVYFAYGIYDCRGTDCDLLPGLTPGLFDIVNLGDRSTYKANPNVQAKKDNYIMIGFHSLNQNVNYNIGPARNALSHEMGHYFGLLDTQQGSDAANCADRERPIGNRTTGDTDRGDLIDDTDADPMSLLLQRGSGSYVSLPYNQENHYCTYTGTEEHCDPALPVRIFRPPTTNIMSYWGNTPLSIGFGERCNDVQTFTPHQVDRMQSYLPARIATDNQYNLRSGVPGVTLSPTISLSTSQNSSEITITQLPGAVDYILERATDVDFTDVTSMPNTSYPFYSSTSNVPIGFNDYTSRPAGKTYYYRIRAINGSVYSNTVSCLLPIATLSGSQTVTNGQSATYTVAFTGTAPWNVQVGGSTYSNVTTSPLKIVTSPFQALQQTYTQTTSGGSVTNTCGTAPMSGTASVTVIGTCPLITANVTYSDIGCGRTTGQGVVQITGGVTPYTIKWRNVTTGVDYTQAYTTAFGLTIGNYTIDVTDANGCRAPQQTFTIRDNGPNGATAVLAGPANNRIVKGQQTAIRIELTGTAPWSVTYSGRGGKQLVASNISTTSYDIAVLPDSSTTYRLVAVSGQCSPTAVSGSATLIVVPALASLEYFVDIDPGIGQATPLSVGFNQTITNQTIGIPLQNRPAGVHTLGFRAKDADGYWSTTTLKPFVTFGQVPAQNAKSIVLVEYTIDGQTPVSVPVAVSNGESIALPISLNLTDGVHIVATRVLDKGTNWSGYTTQPFVVFGTGGNTGQTVTQAEYYIDNDPGVGAAAQLAYNPTPGAPLSLSINPSSLSPGAHTLVVRTKNSRNRWSASYVKAFVVAPLAGTISRIEYFYDTTDPGLGSAASLAFSPANSGTVTAQQGVGVGNLATGAHTITARAQTTLGVWSTTKATSFSVTTCFQALALLTGNYTATTGQPVSVSVGFGGSSPWSLTANGQVFTNLITPSVSFTVQYASSGSYPVNAQTNTLSVANACGAGVVSGTATVAVTGNCTNMYTLKNGNWNDPTVWSCGRLPTSTDAVEIRHNLQLPASYAGSLKRLTIKALATLRFGPGARLNYGP